MARRNIIRNLEACKQAAVAQAHLAEVTQIGLYPLGAPGMPAPGPDFLMHARNLGDDAELVKAKGADGKSATVLSGAAEILADLHRRALREPGFTMPIQVKPGQIKTVSFVPGHLWGQHAAAYAAGEAAAVDGPRPAKVMVLGKMPGRQEVQDLRCLVGESGRLLLEVLRELHVSGTPDWYVTNLVKFQPPDGTTSLRQAWIKDCLPLLHQELRIVRPDYILCLGADASKALLGTRYSVGYMDGRVVELRYPLHPEPTDEPGEELWHTAQVMTVVHPAQVSRAPETRRILERGLARFNLLQQGQRFDQAERDLDHRVIRTLEEAQALCWEIDHDPAKLDKWIGVDAEWQGEHPVNAGSYVRTIQIAWRPKHAAVFVLRNEQGQPCFKDEAGNDALPALVKLLNRFFADKRVAGHFLVADLEWLCHLGLTMIRDRFRMPLYDQLFEKLPAAGQRVLARLGFGAGDMVPAWAQTHYTGGWDTGLAAHAVEETAQLGLEVLAMRYTTVPRYDVPLHDWVVAYCKEKKLKAKDLEGYGMIPDSILLGYAAYDSDTTLRLAYAQMPLIDRDYEGHCCREPFWESMITAMPILEMHQEGLEVDRQRIDELTQTFMAARAAQEVKIQSWARWPHFNIRSVQQVKEFLFGERYNGKVTPDGSIVRLRPRKGEKLPDGTLAAEDGRCLGLEPILDTSKPPKRWKEIKEKGLESEHSPGCLAGDAVIEINRAGKSFKVSIAHVVEYWNGNSHAGKTWDRRIPTMARAQAKDGTIRLLPVRRALYSGERLTYEITTEGGRQLRATGDHPFLTPQGWRQLLLLKPGDPVYVDGGVQVLGRHVKQDYQYVQNLQHHPYARPRRSSWYRVKNGQRCAKEICVSHRVCKHRLVVEADMNGLSYDRFISRLRTGAIAGLRFLPADAVVHHKNGDAHDNRLENLQLFENQAAHAAFHAEDAIAHFTARTAIDRVKSIKKHGVEPTYDLQLDDPHNFLASGFVVHNTGKTILGVLAQDNPAQAEQVQWLRDYRFLDQALKSVLRPPATDDSGNLLREDAADGGLDAGGDGGESLYAGPDNLGNLVYEAGLAAVICDDGRVRTHLYPTTETGRWRSARPNLQNFAKRRDSDYTRMLGKEAYKHKLRSILRAAPGTALIEADYKGAELFCMAILSGDPTLLDHCQRNQLPEDDPNFYDIHSNVAVLAFNLKCPPTKDGLKSIGKVALRVAAKNVIFGLAYGRAAKAIALQCKEEGNPITEEEAQRIINMIFQLYPGLRPFFEEARRRVREERWLCNSFGRFRRFPFTDDFALLGEFERQGMNFGVQSLVASAVDRAGAYLQDYRDRVLRDPNFFRLKLQMHDALLVQAPYANVGFVAEKVLPYAMSECVAIWPTDLKGDPTGAGPYHMGVDVEVHNAWGEHFTPEECERYGIPLQYAK